MPDDILPRRPLGSPDLLVPALGLGSWNTWDRMPPGDAVRIVRRAVEAGAGFFDVASYNVGPHDEGSQTDILFGRAVREAGVGRDDIVVCGKLWLWDWPVQGFRAQLEHTLERAGLERFDAVVVGDYLVEPDVEGLLAEIAEARAAGLFGVWGVNNWHIDTTRAAISGAQASGVAAPAFAQLKYSIARRSMAEGAPYGELFRRGELALQASDVFEGGVLLGNRATARKIGADVGGIRDAIADAAPVVARIAADFGATPAQLAIAFCLTHPATANVLFGASRPEQLETALGAAEVAVRHGSELRAALRDLWIDRDVAANGTWSPVL